jgi:tetratricopeptide (TPR) repeat protein
MRKWRRRFIGVAIVLAGVLMLDRVIELRMQSYEYLPTLFEALANDDGAELDVALAGVMPLDLIFVTRMVVHIYEFVNLPPVSPLAVFVAVERRLQQERFTAVDARHCAALVRDLRARQKISQSLLVPFAWLELRIQLRAFADEDENAPANAAPVDPLRRIDAVTNFLHVVTPHIATLSTALRDRCHLALIVGELIIANEALAVDRCRVGLDAAYDVLVRFQIERLSMASAMHVTARGRFTGLVLHNVLHTIALVCASFGRFDAVRNIDNVFHPTLGELVLSRDLAEGRALRPYLAQTADSGEPRIVRLDSVERASTLVLLTAQHLAAANANEPDSLLFRATAPLEAVALATQNLALLLLLKSPQESIQRFKHAFKTLKPTSAQATTTTTIALLDLDDFLEAESDARRFASPSNHFSDFDQLVKDADAQLEALEFLEHVSADAARLAFVRGKLWHQYRATQHALMFYDEALSLLDRSSGDYAVVQTYRRRAAHTLTRHAGDDTGELVSAVAAEEAERSLMSLARVAAANGVTMPTRTNDFDGLRRNVADAVHASGVKPPPPSKASSQLRLTCVTEDDLSEAVGMAWTSVELGGMCTPCMQRQRLAGVRWQAQLPGAGNAIDWRWLHAMEREWTNERSK